MLRRLRPPRRRLLPRPLRPPLRRSPPPRHLALVQPRGRGAQQVAGLAPPQLCGAAAWTRTGGCRLPCDLRRPLSAAPRHHHRTATPPAPSDGRAVWHRFTTPTWLRTAPAPRPHPSRRKIRRFPRDPPERPGAAAPLLARDPARTRTRLCPPTAAPEHRPGCPQSSRGPRRTAQRGIAPPPRCGPPTVDTMRCRGTYLHLTRRPIYSKKQTRSIEGNLQVCRLMYRLPFEPTWC